MAKGTKLKKEEYVPAAIFLKKSFERDRLDLVTRFSEFTPEYLSGFDAQLTKVDTLEAPFKVTEAQKKVTENLFTAANLVSKELNFLSFYFKRAKLDTAILTKIKNDIARHNIEGACDKIKGLLQYVVEHHEVLESKGMAVGFPAEMEVAKADLEAKNALQNEIMNNKGQLYEDNALDYTKLYEFISTIANAGKIMYNGLGKVDEYTVTKMISRMRGGGSGGDSKPPTPSV
jgi:hypothetical protein